MINLFENYRSEEIDLETSLKISGFKHKTIVLQDDGYLPEDIDSPIRFFTQNETTPNENIPLFFNDLKLPAHWEVQGNNGGADIFEGYKQKGKIHYSNRKDDFRFIQSVEWWNEQEKQRAIDLYNQHGQRFGHKTFSDGGLSLTTYFDSNGKEVIVQNHITGTLQLYYQNQTYIFSNYQSFVLFYFKVAGIDSQNIFYNSLGIPYFITLALERENPETAYSHTLFWQETSSTMPGNMKGLLETKGSTKHIIVQNKEEYGRLQKQINFETKVSMTYLGWIYPFKESRAFIPTIFILTNSDNIEHLKELTESLPDYHFNIAARTEMSGKLMDFGNLKNVSLYPGVSSDEIENLFEANSVYLDINHGNEVENIVRQAFEHQQLIFAFQETAHNKRFTVTDYIWKAEQFEKMVEKMKQLNQSNIEQLINLQKLHAGQESIKNYKKVIGHA